MSGKTRSKITKVEINYPIPETFSRKRPQFPGQNFDIYVQKSNNLQIWNEGIVPLRRYIIIRIDQSNKVTKVKVVYGTDLIAYNKTGKLTHKYQSSCYPKPHLGPFELHVTRDTDQIGSLGASLQKLVCKALGYNEFYPKDARKLGPLGPR